MCWACHWLRESDDSQTRFALLCRKQLAVAPTGLMGDVVEQGHVCGAIGRTRARQETSLLMNFRDC